ncbi:hypothetical protein QJS10_CPA09g01701 [Acorus calamus]|uniref:Uncharacterized protein n=1 Tax=Acorus calamus TaxID=4465 RepID=A0AAV9E4P4_ACOCL|nr:hypothetical protein QJS10_CPA09g01701 [Acorus calamus]
MLVVVGDTRGLRVLLCHLSIPPNQSSYAFNVIVKQVLGVAPDEPQSTEILEDFLTFMKGFISFPLYIPGTPCARVVQIKNTIKEEKK